MTTVGSHVQLDLETTKPVGEKTIEKFIKACAKDLNLTIVYGPTTKRRGKHITTVAIIAESHIIVAKYEKTIFVDVFSCVPFDKEKVVSICYVYFSPQNLRERFFIRGF